MGHQPATHRTRRRGRSNGLSRILVLVAVCGAGGALLAAAMAWALLELAGTYR